MKAILVMPDTLDKIIDWLLYRDDTNARLALVEILKNAPTLEIDKLSDNVQKQLSECTKQSELRLC